MDPAGESRTPATAYPLDLGPDEPLPPIAFPAPFAELGEHLRSDRVEVPAAVRERLAAACASVTDDARTLAEAGRDWWPVGLHWALAGETVARPDVVVRPADAAEVAAVLAICNEAGIPVSPFAGRSGVCGGSVPVHGGVSMDLAGLAGIRSVDTASGIADVGAGTFGDHLEAALRRDHGVTLGHWPQSMSLSTVGGWLACRSAGQYSTRYGKIEDLVIGLDVVLADGTTLHTGGTPRAAAGPDLNQLFVGSEGTLGVVTGARLRVFPLPPAERRVAFGFGSFLAGLEVCRRVLRRGANPAVLRLYDPLEASRHFGAYGVDDETAVLVVIDEGDPALVDANLGIAAEEARGAGASDLPVAVADHWFAHRNDVSALEKVSRQGVVADTMEIAAPWAALPAVYEAAVAALLEVPGALVASAHESHAYPDGACLYFTFAGMPGEAGGVDAYYNASWEAAARAVLANGGNLSHHHGVGLNRARFVGEALGAGAGVLARLKAALDPAGILNPGKLGLPDPFGAVRWP